MHSERDLNTQSRKVILTFEIFLFDDIRGNKVSGLPERWAKILQWQEWGPRYAHISTKKSQDPEMPRVGTQICPYLDKYKKRWQSNFSWKSQDRLVKIMSLGTFWWRPKMEIWTIRSPWKGLEALKWRWKDSYTSFRCFSKPHWVLFSLIYPYLNLFGANNVK